jgi:hypothetical protein
MPQTLTVGARSRFVTAIAWIVIVIATVSMLAALFPHPEGATPPNGVLASMFSAALPWLLGAAALFSLASAVTAGGLLLRFDWARRLFIALLVLTLVAHLPALWLQYERLVAFLQHLLQPAAPLPLAVMQTLEGVMWAAHGLAAGLVLLAVALLAWIARRLNSPSIRQEFA